uniref:Uncharacterized protein n=1 Tax=Cannabis sativa TaxID=3483 RepID=A0A803NXJ0_CANSA
MDLNRSDDDGEEAQSNFTDRRGTGDLSSIVEDFFKRRKPQEQPNMELPDIIGRIRSFSAEMEVAPSSVLVMAALGGVNNPILKLYTGSILVYEGAYLIFKFCNTISKDGSSENFELSIFNHSLDGLANTDGVITGEVNGMLIAAGTTYVHWLTIEAKTCNPSGKIKGKRPPPGQCNQENDSDCCKQGKSYTTYNCSPRVTGHTKAVLTLNSFEKGGDGGAPSECDHKYHSDSTPVVALSTGWFSNMQRCLQNITIYGNGRSVNAMVVDECDSTAGCDSDHDYQPPCPNNIVDASKAVWKALRVPEGDWGELDIYWSQA